jgi:glucose 1-dehydrogenase
MPDLSGHTAVVTGAESGIGAATAAALAAKGAAVAVLYFHDEAGAERTLDAVRQHGRTGATIAVDVRDEAAVERAFDAVTATLGSRTS